MVCFFIWGIMACSAYVVSHFSIRNWREQCFIRIWFLFLFFFLPPERAKGWPIFVLKKKGVHELMISLSYQWYGMGPYRHANELQCWTVNCSSFVCIVKKALTRQTQGQPFPYADAEPKCWNADQPASPCIRTAAFFLFLSSKCTGMTCNSRIATAVQNLEYGLV